MMVRMVMPALLAALAAFGQPALAQEQQLVRMGTGVMSGAYFRVGVALCRLANEDRREHGIRCSAEPTSGSVDNIEKLRAGEIDLALVQSDVQSAAVSGQTGEPFKDLRSLLSLHEEPLTIVTRSDTGITGLQDLPGRKISAGTSGSGTRAVWETLSDHLGWTSDTFAEVQELEGTALTNALCSDRIDAFVLVVGHPAPMVQEATLTCGAVVAGAEGPEVDAFLAENTHFFPTEIPGAPYPNNPGPVASFGVGATLVTRADLDDAVVQALIAPALGRVDELRGLDPVLAGLSRKHMLQDGLTAPLHPAVEPLIKDDPASPE